MTTGGVSRPGLTACGVWLGLALLTSTVATGCGASGQSDVTSAGGIASPSTSPRATPDEELRTRVVAYWSRKVLDTHTYGDYQSMGLSNRQYGILRTVVDAARAEKRLQGPEATRKLIDRQSREGCAAWYRTGGPSKGPWG
ncbi:hypothetical protein ACFW08_11255 [Streptomyces sp. NPDC058960]|uniref:hypothetical protein n=1 Tax=Streptomyces sp. NPDC058960 TaxID=3346679 RepID=UPI0036A48E33